MPQTNHGSIEFLKFPDPQHPGDNTRLIKKWLRDSWARRKIVALQTALANQLKYKDVSGTTSASGNITLDLNASLYMVISIRVSSASNGIAQPWSAGTSWYTKILNTDGTVKANTAVTLKVAYIAL